MIVNVDLSRKLKSEKNHRIKQCYKNAFTLWQSKDVDEYVVGLCTAIHDGKKVLIRHGWGVKDNKIVDSTFGYPYETFEDIEYFPIFEFKDSTDMEYLMRKADGHAAIGYDTYEEDRMVTEIILLTNLRYMEK